MSSPLDSRGEGTEKLSQPGRRDGCADQAAYRQAHLSTRKWPGGGNQEVNPLTSFPSYPPVLSWLLAGLRVQVAAGVTPRVAFWGREWGRGSGSKPSGVVMGWGWRKKSSPDTECLLVVFTWFYFLYLKLWSIGVYLDVLNVYGSDFTFSLMTVPNLSIAKSTFTQQLECPYLSYFNNPCTFGSNSGFSLLFPTFTIL